VLRFHVYPILDEDVIVRGSLDVAGLLDLWSGEGAAFFQYRAKSLSSLERGKRLASILPLALSRRLRCIINDDFGLALSGLGDGFHLGHEDRASLTAGERILLRDALKGRVHPLHHGSERLSGLSTHSAEQLAEALALHESGDFPLSYVALGPCFPTSSKTEGLYPLVSADVIGQNLGLLHSRGLSSSLPPDLVLIGGISPDVLPGLIDGIVEALRRRGSDALLKDPRPLHVYMASISAAADPGSFRQLCAVVAGAG
jgi:thiamine monophosphate synthase